jgi:VWFA-related protein
MATFCWITAWVLCASLAGQVQILGRALDHASGAGALLGALHLGRPSPRQEPPVERHTWEKRLPFVAGGEVEVENRRGRILVKEGAAEDVHVVADATPALVLTDELKIQARKSKLIIKCPSSDRPGSVDLRITVPSGVRLKLKAEEGTVQVRGRVSEIHAETLSGDVILDVPVDDVKIDVTWMEGYMRYGGPELRKVTAPAAMRPAGQSRVPPAVLSGQTGQGRVQLSVRTLNGWVEIGPETTAGRVIVGAAPPQPLSQAAQAIARRRQSPLGEAIRLIEPRVERAVQPPGSSSPSKTSADEDDVVQLESSLVNLNVSVTDAQGKVISGLTAKDFGVSEDGVQQSITHFATEATPFNLVLLLDVSGSTRGKIELIRQAALRFIELMHPSEKIAVLLFARDVEVVSPLTGDREVLRRALSQIAPPLGSTALYDAIAYALVEQLDRTRGERNAIVVVTDGRESSLSYADGPLANDPLRRPGSFLRFEDLLTGVRHADALVYPIAIDNEAEQLAVVLAEPMRQRLRTESRRAQAQLKQLADISGGRFYSATQLENLDGVYEQIAADLRTIYSVAYMPTRAERDGSWRSVAVSISRPGARVRCARGYFAR